MQETNKIVPSYMRNVSSILKIKEKLNKISWDVEGERLFNRNKSYLKPNEQKLAKLLILKDVPYDKRGQVWMISSGAKKEMLNNPGYYSFLIKEYPHEIELPSEKQIDLDIKRTFPQDPFYTDITLNKMRNVLLAYSKRNLSVGYVQGFNFIVGRLFKFIHNEEEVFWMFTQIVEYLLPVNFYSEMAGLMIDVDILMCLIHRYFPSMQLDEFQLLYFKNVLFQWFLSLFIQNLSFEANLSIWDAFFIDGSIVLFKTALALIKLVKDDLGKITNPDKFRNFLKEFFTNFKDDSYLKFFLVLRRFEFNISFIEKNRRALEPTIVDQIKRINEIKIQKLKEKIKEREDFCNEEWPICIYDCDSYYSVCDNVCFKAMSFPDLVENYFTREKFSSKKNANKLEAPNYTNVLIERKHHCCSKAKTKLDMISDVEEASADNSTGSAEVSFAEEKSFNKSSGKENLSNEKIHQIAKKNYKRLRQQQKKLCISSISYSRLKSNKDIKKDRDFETFVSKINLRYDKLSQAQSFYLKNLGDIGDKQNDSVESSFDY